MCVCVSDSIASKVAKMSSRHLVIDADISLKNTCHHKVVVSRDINNNETDRNRSVAEEVATAKADRL